MFTFPSGCTVINPQVFIRSHLQFYFSCNANGGLKLLLCRHAVSPILQIHNMLLASLSLGGRSFFVSETLSTSIKIDKYDEFDNIFDTDDDADLVENQQTFPLMF